MVNLQKSGDSAVKIVFTDSDHYLYGNGEIEVPVNSLLLAIDESEMVTFKKLSGDPFLSFRADNSNLGTKEAIEQFYKENMVGSTGGGDVTSGDVETMIDTALDDYYDKDEVDAGFDSVNATLSGKADTTTVNQIAEQATQAITALSGAVQTKQDALTAGQGIDITNNVISSTVNITVDPTLDTGSTNPVANSAITQALENKLDASAYTPTDLSEYWTSAQTQSAIDGVNDALTAHTANTTVHVTSAEKTAWNAKQDALYIYTEDNNLGTAELHSNDSSIIFNAGGASITANNIMGVNTFNVASTGVTINGENVATEPYVDAALSGKADTSAVTAAIDALTAHTSDTGIHVSAQEKNAWNAKAEPYSAGTGIEISGNVISATGGGGMDDDTQQLISTAFNDLNDRKADLTELSKYQKKGDYVETSTLADYMTNDAFDEYATAKERIISGALNDLDNRMTAVESGGSAITTAITSGSTDSEIPTAKATYDAIQAGGGGGATYSAGTNISIDTGNTINCTLPITANTDGSIAVGRQVGSSNLGQLDSFTLSQNLNKSRANGFAVGRTTDVNNFAEAGFGAYSNNYGNYTGDTYFRGRQDATLFTVGNGSSTAARHNALEIRQNGDLYFADTDNTTYANFYQKPMVRLQDMYGALGGLKLVKLTQAEYDALATKDSSTLYIISD